MKVRNDIVEYAVNAIAAANEEGKSPTSEELAEELAFVYLSPWRLLCVFFQSVLYKLR